MAERVGTGGKIELPGGKTVAVIEWRIGDGAGWSGSVDVSGRDLPGLFTVLSRNVNLTLDLGEGAEVSGVAKVTSVPMSAPAGSNGRVLVEGEAALLPAE